MEERLEKAGGMALDSERAEGETKEGDGDENKVEIQFHSFRNISVLGNMVTTLTFDCDDILSLFLWTQKKSIEGGKQGASIKKQKKDKAVSATMKSARPEATPVPTAPRVKPELTLPVM